MANTSVDGLISGLGTSDLISQLMLLERQPQQRLVSQTKAIGTTNAAYQALNTRFDAIGQAAEDLGDPSSWQAMKATTGDTARIGATASAGALAGSLTVSVERLATAHTVVSEVAVAGLDAVVATGDITLTVDGVASDPISVGDGTLASAVQAINDAGAGVSAAAVQVSPGQYRLQLTATSTGAASAFTVTGLSLADGGDGDPEVFDVLTVGADAELKVGGSGGYSVASPSNTFTDLLPGVSLTAVKADPGVTVAVGVASDAEALATKVQKLVTAVNDALKAIGEATNFDATTGTKGILLGNSLTRQLQQSVYGALRLDAPGSSLADVGLKLGATGLELDKDAFLQAYAADPAAVIDHFTGADTVEGPGVAGDGLAQKLSAVATGASHKDTGLLSVAIESGDRKSALIQRQVESWDARLQKREASLRRQYAAMEVALSNLQNQSTWLSGQISGLPSWE